MVKFTKAEKRQAYELGKKACEKGAILLPFMDDELIALIYEDRDIPMGQGAEMFKAYNKGLTDTLIFMPIEF